MPKSLIYQGFSGFQFFAVELVEQVEQVEAIGRASPIGLALPSLESIEIERKRGYSMKDSLIDFDSIMQQLGENAIEVPEDTEEQDQTTGKQLSNMLRKEAAKNSRNSGYIKRRY